MANTRVKSLFVLTLLQLCRAEISDNLPEWYSANVINDGFQPKSISEIFSTESPFSSTNPIVVLPKSTPMPDKILSSTLAPPSSITGDFTKTSIIPLPSSTPLPPTISTISPQFSTEYSSRFPSQSPQVEITQYTEQTQPPSQSLFETQPELRQTTSSSSIPPYTLEQQTTLGLATPSPPIGRFLLPEQNTPDYLSTQQQSTSSTPGIVPNYFVVYQQPPQHFQDFPGQSSSLQGGLFGIHGFQQSSTIRPPGSTVVIQPTSTVSPSTSQITSSTPLPTSLTSTSRRSTTKIPTSTKPTSVGPSRAPTTQFTQQIGNCQNATQYPNIGGLPVRIRVVGPRGSITHVNINPPMSVASTTTTKRPTTTRTRKTPKPKKNTYESCIGGCKARRDPICAIPLSVTWIDPDKLKGFPSVCHMACFNSYKKELMLSAKITPLVDSYDALGMNWSSDIKYYKSVTARTTYEKLLDGRCGRLRTRIHTFNSKTKLNREELNKAQYVIDNGDQTIVEVSALRHKRDI